MALQNTSSRRAANRVKPPLARVSLTKLVKHGQVRVDPYYWLCERHTQEVVNHLKEENNYCKSVMAHTEPLQELLFKEIKERIKQADMSVPYRQGNYYYYMRFEESKEYPIYCRQKETLDGAEQTILDVNVMAKGYDFYAVENHAISSSQNILAYAVDTVGRLICSIQFRNLETGEFLPDVIPNVTSNIAWANDNRTLFYVKQDPKTLRPNCVYRHSLGIDVSEDELVYEETDETFTTSVFKTKSKKYMMVVSTQTVSTEYRFLDLEADGSTGSFTLFLSRSREHEYHVDHKGDKFYVRTNLNAKNFRLIETSIKHTGVSHWHEVVSHRPGVLLAGIEIFKDHLVLHEREAGLTRICIQEWSGQREHYLNFQEQTYSTYIGDNPEQNTHVLRYGYTSMTSPNSIYDYDMISRKNVLLKRDEILGRFNATDYVTDRVYATAADGTKIPISLVYRKEFMRDGGRPLLLYGYGSYGLSLDSTFSSPRLSLIDRGFTYAIAHVRGGQELGRSWYEDGKLLNKKNTFTDFIACADHLIQEGYSSSDRLFAMGGSAGGLLVGAVLNMRPELFKGVLALVPFVDVVTTMLDEDVPLTTGEYDEWGNPNDREYFDYMLSYSPYDNVEYKRYPYILVTAGLHDSQVQYWEPAKWVAKLRAVKSDQNLVILKTNMDAGHSGASGRYKRYRETALNYAFLLDLAGING